MFKRDRKLVQKLGQRSLDLYRSQIGRAGYRKVIGSSTNTSILSLPAKCNALQLRESANVHRPHVVSLPGFIDIIQKRI